MMASITILPRSSTKAEMPSTTIPLGTVPQRKKMLAKTSTFLGQPIVLSMLYEKSR